jgi:hypothetical protein
MGLMNVRCRVQVQSRRYGQRITRGSVLARGKAKETQLHVSLSFRLLVQYMPWEFFRRSALASRYQYHSIGLCSHNMSHVQHKSASYCRR